MCFISSDTKIYKAEKDIEVYKILDLIDGINKDKTIPVSLYKEKLYTINLLNEHIRITPIYSKFCKELIEINEGYHSYIHIDSARRAKRPLDEFSNLNTVIAKFIIPEGTIFYKNNKVYVSEQIIYKEIIDE